MADTCKPFLGIDGRDERPCNSLYVHVPVCRQRCGYCDFYSIVCDEEAATTIVDALLAELPRRRDELASPPATVFVGGGTPTALPTGSLKRLLSALGSYIDSATEFTVETNPGTLTSETLAILGDAGVNRLSIGIQSLFEDELRVLDRTHDASTARRAVHSAVTGGIDDVSVDLIYGIPGQTVRTWRHTLQAVLELPVTHVSCYCLSYPEGTPIAGEVEAGRLRPMGEDVQRDCYEMAIDMLGEAGLDQYEISNFAAAGHACKHNITYWENRPYIGIGPSAASYVRGERLVNTDNADQYVRLVTRGASPVATSECLTGAQRMAETLILALRLRKGMSINTFHNYFGLNPMQAFPQTLRRHRQLGTITMDGISVALHRRGLFVSDSVFADLIAEAHLQSALE